MTSKAYRMSPTLPFPKWWEMSLGAEAMSIFDKAVKATDQRYYIGEGSFKDLWLAMTTCN